MKQHVILIVDDDPGARNILETLLIRDGYKLVFSESGQETLALLETLRPDVILLDIMMPGLDGFEVCRRIRQTPKIAEVPIIMVTALDDIEARVEGLEAGADDFTTKPFDRVELRARVQTILHLNRYRKLVAERAKFEWVVEHAENGYVIIDGDDHILYANQKAKRYLEFSQDVAFPLVETFTAHAKKIYQCQPMEAWAQWPQQDEPAMPRYLVRPETKTANAFG